MNEIKVLLEYFKYNLQLKMFLNSGIRIGIIMRYTLQKLRKCFFIISSIAFYGSTAIRENQL